MRTIHYLTKYWVPLTSVFQVYDISSARIRHVGTGHYETGASGIGADERCYFWGIIRKP